MQRQSLGSPASKLQIHVAKEQKFEGAENRKGEEDEEEDKKADNKLFKSTSRTHKSIHLIPLLIISYLVSIRGFEGISLQKDSVKINDFERFFEVEKSEISTLQSHRSLQEVGKRARRSSPSNLHRKLGDF
ncbi:hypothetical protein CKAN_01624900 [Cinnamomum micranthum f. kanehirae]|uniref:Uncharacterized protein n=1 Tax=Cinnamomum micranthum f. kanehirae TaxID=337451 RepID=A0A3S3PBN7_9MAGN|nr:hypothetical protein CKAN_01624900 [Cinnamomum micranthum f. kanehirae]